MESDAYISARLAGTLDGLFRERVRRSPDRPAYTYYSRETRQWQSLTWADMGRKVGRWQQALKRASLEAGDRVAIMLRNGPDWVAVDQAALGLGLVVVPLYTDDRPDNMAYIIQDAGARVIVVQTAHHWHTLLQSGSHALTGVQHVIIMEGEADPGQTPEGTRLWSLSAWLPDEPAPLSERGGDARALATIVYTSGTTGKPKGVMLSHANILSVSEGAGLAMKVRPEQRFLSFLPLSHTFERSCGYYAPMMWGMEIAYARSVQTLAEDLLTIKPQILVAVPRIFERIYNKIQAQLARSSPFKRRLFQLAVDTGWRHFEACQGRARHRLTHLLWPVLKRRVACPLLASLGGNIELAISGGAALSPPVAKMFLGLGLNLIQGYGMTESAPVVSANRPERNEPHSVGLPLDGVQVRIGENDELQVNSPGVMLGYWNNHKASREVMTRDGWLRTGDKAHIQNGFIYITGRLKDILVMSNGEKIPPVDMEEAIKLDPLIDNAVIVGEGKPYLAALLVLNGEDWFTLAREHQLDPFDPAALQDPTLHKTLLQRIGTCLHNFPGYAKVRRVTPLLEPWSVENGLLTPTLKTKRQLVMERFTQAIEDMYEH
ncbi:MAG: AMP-dependent synthetase/ligase [Gammaproteobacteria bacterium]|jgi:long-chain acyl-CoA synthetase